MNNEVVSVGLGELKIRRNSADVLVAYGLGSCLGVGMYDPAIHLAGLLHAVLPTSTAAGAPQTRFVDTGIPLLLERMLEAGGQMARLTTYLVGGATMLPRQTEGMDIIRIGERNVAAARSTIAHLGVKVTCEAVGGSRGRTVRLYVQTGELTLRTLGNHEELISTFVL